MFFWTKKPGKIDKTLAFIEMQSFRISNHHKFMFPISYHLFQYVWLFLSIMNGRVDLYLDVQEEGT